MMFFDGWFVQENYHWLTKFFPSCKMMDSQAPGYMVLILKTQLEYFVLYQLCDFGEIP